MKNFLLIVIVAIGFCVTIRTGLAQNSPVWQHFQFSGAPDCMIEDGQYLWIGNGQGLTRYDRTVDTFANYYVGLASNNNWMTANWVTALTRAKDGSIWVGRFRGGLSRFSNNTWTTFTPANSLLPGEEITALAADSLGRVWVGTQFGLAKFESGNWAIYTTQQAPFTSDAIYALAADALGDVWIATSHLQIPGKGSIVKFDGAATWEIHNGQTDIGFDSLTDVSSMLCARSGDLWLGTEGYLDHLQGKSWLRTIGLPDYNGPTKNQISSLSEDASGAIWLSDAYGAGRFDGSTWRTFDITKGTCPFARCRAVIADPNETWVASFNDVDLRPYGIAKLAKGKWTVFDSLSNCSLDHNRITAMTIDSKGRYWFGSRDINQDRLCMFDGNVWTHFDTLMGGTSAISLCADSVGDVFIGTSGSGVVKWDGIKAVHYDFTNTTLHSCVISALAYDDPHKTLWVGEQFDTHSTSPTPAGIAKFDGSTWTNYTVADSPLPGMEQSSMTIDATGVWTTTWYDGLAHFDGSTTWKVFNTANSLIPSDRVWKVTSAPNGDIWIATEKGAARWNGSSWTPFTTANSGMIQNLATCGVAINGHVWFGAFQITNADPSACEFDGTNWATYARFDPGIRSNQLQDIMGGEEGDIWFATNDQGLVRYFPTGVKPPCLNRVAHLTIIDSAQIASSTNDGIVGCVIAIKDSVPQLLGLNVVSFTVKYEASMLSRKSVTALNGWKIAAMQDVAGGLALTLTSPPHDVRPGEAIVAVDLQTFVGQVSSSTVLLTDTRFNPSDPKFENCTLASIAQDSLLISLASACGDSTIRAMMDRTPLLQLLRVNPDPVRIGDRAVHITLSAMHATYATAIVTSLSGIILTSQRVELAQGVTSHAIDLEGLEQGSYMIEVKAANSSVSAKFVVE